MKLPELNILCIKYGQEPASDQEVRNETSRIIDLYKDMDPGIRELQKNVSNTHGQIEGKVFKRPVEDLYLLLNKRRIEVLLRAIFPKGIAFANLSVDNKGNLYCTVINIPRGEEISFTCLGIWLDWNVDWLQQIQFEKNESAYLSPDDEIRHLLSGSLRKRKGLFIAGSPGWDDETLQHGAVSTLSKNTSALDATLNDANSIFQLFHSLTRDDSLPGIVSGFLIRKKEQLLELLNVAAMDVTKELLDDELSKTLPLDGFFSVDSVIPSHGALFGEGTMVYPETVMMTPNNYKTSLAQRTYNETPCGFSGGSFAVIYYSGHGSLDGNIQIEKNLSISPKEVFDISYRTKVPYLLILDMCYAWKFGRNYQKLLKEYDWNGIVMCANDISLSYESNKLGWCQRIYWETGIFNSDWSLGRGMYSTALTCGIIYLRQLELFFKKPLNLSLADFNDKILIPICHILSNEYRIPIQRPTYYAHVPQQIHGFPKRD